jgi:hypothetical protein
MSTFSPDVHTPYALAEEIDFINQTYPDAILVGSLGRGGIYKALVSDAEYEYSQRGQQPTQTFRGGAADIDIINAPIQLEGLLSPFDCDLKSFCGRQVAIAQVGVQWILSSENRGFVAEIDERVMEPTVAKTVYGAKCRTLPPQTHLKLLGLTGTVRKQDEIAQGILKRTIDDSHKAQLPAELYEPFDELFELNYRSAMTTARRAYRAAIPLSIRRSLAPTMQRVKDHHLR